MAEFLGEEVKNLSFGKLKSYAAGAWQRIFGGSTDDQRLKIFRKNPWVYAAVSQIALDVSIAAQKNLKLFRTFKGKKLEVSSSQALDFMARNFATKDTQYTLFWRSCLQLCLTGDAVWWVDKTEHKAVFLPEKFSIQTDRLGFAVRYDLDFGGQTKSVLPEEVVHFQIPSADKMLDGVSPAEAAEMAVKSDIEAESWNAAVFAGNGMPASLLLISDQYSEEQAESLKLSWGERFSGSKNRAKTEIIRGLRSDGSKAFDHIVMGKTQKDMDFVKGADNNRDRILGAFKVPRLTLGQGDGVQVGNSETIERIYYQNAVADKLLLIQDALNSFYLPMFSKTKGLFFEFDLPNPISAEVKIKQEQADLASGVRTVNEVRAERGFDPVQGGDRNLIPFNMTDLQPQKSPPKAEETKSKSVKKNINVDSLLESYEARLDALEAKFLAAIFPVFEAQEKAVLDRVDAFFSKKSVRKKYDDSLNIDRERDESKLAQASASVFYLVALEEARESMNELGLVPAGDEVMKPLLKKYIDPLPKKFAYEVSDTTYQDLKTRITAVFDTGGGEVEVRNAVKKVFSPLIGESNWRSALIARTETGRAINIGREKSYLNAGIKKWQWLAVGDDRTRSAHSNVKGENGEEFIEIGKNFNVGGEMMTRPNDPNASASNTINCRCRTLAKIN